MGFVFLISLGFQFVDVIAAITSKLFNEATVRTNARVGFIKIFPLDNLVTNLHPTGRKFS